MSPRVLTPPPDCIRITLRAHHIHKPMDTSIPSIYMNELSTDPTMLPQPAARLTSSGDTEQRVLCTEEDTAEMPCPALLHSLVEETRQTRRKS